MNEQTESDRARAQLEQALQHEAAVLTPAGRMIAAYLRDNLGHIPYETGASIAAKTGVSEMSVIRFIRSLGFANLKELKDDLRSANGAEGSVDDVLERFRVHQDDMGELQASLEMELRAVVEAYQLTALERWHGAVDLLAERKHVHVVGFQASKGLAIDFASRLKYARRGVRFAEGGAGVYSEILESEPDDSCLVLVDTVAYARKGQLLARRSRDMKIPLIVVTDRFSNWAYEFTDLVLQGSTHVRTFWDSTASLSVILNLLINAVVGRLGDQARQRFELMKELGRHFGEFDNPSARSMVRRLSEDES